MNRKKALKLFTPVQLGSLNLKHRVVMAPLTRSRSEQPGGIPGDMMVQYYSDRASDGGLIVGEATNISLTARFSVHVEHRLPRMSWQTAQAGVVIGEVCRLRHS